jgi:hypothetical protein
VAKKGGKFQNAAQNFLEGIGIKGGLQGLIRRAIVQGWDIEEFANAVMETKAFRTAFPGLVDFKTGLINGHFSSRRSGSSALLEAVSNYFQGLEDFQNAAKNLNLPDIGKRGYASLIRNDISLEEFGARATAVQTAQGNPELLAMFNEQLKFQGLKPLDDKGFYRFIAKAGSNDFYDAYQAAYLRNAGLDLTAAEAGGLAQSLDPGKSGNINLSELVAQINLYQADIGPELTDAGIGDAELALVAGGGRPDLVPKLQQLVAQRRAIQQTPRQQSVFEVDEGERGF